VPTRDELRERGDAVPGEAGAELLVGGQLPEEDLDVGLSHQLIPTLHGALGHEACHGAREAFGIS
jgi:hypothetical protein